MNNASLELGGTNWAEKDGNILGYSVGDTSGKYSPQEFTFARGSNLSATRIDRAGLIVKGRENLVKQSNSFGTAPWTASNATLTSGQSGYDGSNDAWKLEANTTAQTYVNQVLLSSINAGTPTTFSVYAKSGNVDFLKILLVTTGSNSIITFDLTDGSTYSNLRNISVNAENVGNGWYRCSITAAPGTNITAVRTEVRSAPLQALADAGSFIYIQDSQAELGLAASPYIETTTTTAQSGVLENTPRLNYTTGVANPYLLLEPSRTNLLEYSEYFGAWNNATYPVTITSNSATSPDGNLNATLITPTSGNSRHATRDLNVVAASGTTYTLTAFFKKAGSRYVVLGDSGDNLWRVVTADLDNGTITDETNATGTIEPYENDWYRVTCTFTRTNAVTIQTFLGASPTDTNSSAPSFDDTSLTTYVYGAQAEVASYPTSYIPTYSVSATRAVDVCNKLDASGEIGQTEGTVFFEWDYQNVGSSGGNIVVSLAGTHLQEIYFWVQGNGNYIYDVYNSSQQVNISGSMGSFEIKKIALAYKNNDFALYINGVLAGTDTSGSVPTLDRLYIGGYALNTNYNISSGINQVLLYKERLTNAELATLTTI